MSKTILLADDSVTIQKVVELTFMDSDYEVVAVGDGDEAMQRLGEGGWDLVVADVHMPGVSGYEVARAAKQAHPGVPVLLLVGTFESFDADQADEAGADAHLKKPFDSQELLRLVGELASRRVVAPEAIEEAEPEAYSLDDEDTQVWALPEEGSELELLDGAQVDLDELPELPDLPEGAAWDDEDDLEILPEGDLEASAETVRVAVAEAPVSPPSSGPEIPGRLSDEDVERVARRVVELLGDHAVKEVAWEVVPDMAELVVKDRLRELEREIDEAAREN